MGAVWLGLSYRMRNQATMLTVFVTMTVFATIQARPQQSIYTIGFGGFGGGSGGSQGGFSGLNFGQVGGGGGGWSLGKIPGGSAYGVNFANGNYQIGLGGGSKKGGF